MADYCKYVNVFHGSGKIQLPKPEGIAASWHFIKAICGNTHPGAQLPFGKYSVGCYTSGYPTGYGNHLCNTNPELRTFGEKPLCYGFSHLHQSGTGTMGIYYNYCVTVPFYGEISGITTGREITRETARPGYYSLVTGEDNIKCEVTAGEKCVCHRYTFTKPGARLGIDLSNDSFRLHETAGKYRCKKAEINILSENSFSAVLNMRGLDLFVYAEISGANTPVIWQNGSETKGREAVFGEADGMYGVAFNIASPCTAEMKLAFSVKSAQKAKENVTGENRSFDAIAENAYGKWNEVLSKVEIDTPSEKDKEIFYSNFYHSLVKPSDWSGESFIYDDDEFMCDIATMWDIYKTQLPLIFMLYPEISRKLLVTFAAFCEKAGTMPHSLTLGREGLFEHNCQAMMLVEHSVYDAYLRGIDADYGRLLNAARLDLKSDTLKNVRDDTCYRLTHKLDAAEACACMSELAQKLGESSAEFDKYKDIWEQTFDKETGLMFADSDYYEGSGWNFSFRPLHNMEKRVELAGGKAGFEALLDRFFGYTFAEDTSARFEGYNNESDMEAPLAYYWADRHDKLCEVSAAGLDCMFTTGRGGLPGNNDSGGLSSLYMWHAAGIHPVTGQNLMIIGSPRMNKTVFHLFNGKDFTVERSGKGIYVKDAYLNGEKLSEFSFTVTQLMSGGILKLEMEENHE